MVLVSMPCLGNLNPCLNILNDLFSAQTLQWHMLRKSDQRMSEQVSSGDKHLDSKLQVMHGHLPG